MSKARAVAWLYASIAVAALATVVAGLVVSLGRVDYSGVGVDRIVSACRTWVLADGGAAAVAVLILGVVGTAVLTLAARSAARQVRATRRFVGRLAVVGRLPGEPPVMVIDDAAPRAFCVGLLRPRVFISSSALALLSGAERAAVLAHEAHHVRCRDPLRLLVTRSLAEGFVVLPALRRLADRYAALAELAADEAAERTPRGSQALGSALLAFHAHPDPAVVGIAPERVDRLLGDRARWGLPGLGLAGAAVTLLVTWAVTVRLSQVAHASVPLPDLLVQACMLAMAVVPLVVGTGAVLGVRRAVVRR
ncbi:MAG: M56 family metallopeptidase [Solirubrobacteraceae bacterium]